MLLFGTFSSCHVSCIFAGVLPVARGDSSVTWKASSLACASVNLEHLCCDWLLIYWISLLGIELFPKIGFYFFYNASTWRYFVLFLLARMIWSVCCPNFRLLIFQRRRMVFNLERSELVNFNYHNCVRTFLPFLKIN